MFPKKTTRHRKGCNVKPSVKLLQTDRDKTRLWLVDQLVGIDVVWTTTTDRPSSTTSRLGRLTAADVALSTAPSRVKSYGRTRRRTPACRLDRGH